MKRISYDDYTGIFSLSTAEAASFTCLSLSSCYTRFTRAVMKTACENITQNTFMQFIIRLKFPGSKISRLRHQLGSFQYPYNKSSFLHVYYQIMIVTLENLSNCAFDFCHSMNVHLYFKVNTLYLYLRRL